jgi:hypothetical protein
MANNGKTTISKEGSKIELLIFPDVEVSAKKKLPQWLNKKTKKNLMDFIFCVTPLTI